MSKHHLLPVVLVAACVEAVDAPVELGPAPEVTASAPVLRRLTASQYEHALVDLFGDDLYIPASPEPDLRLSGLARLGASEVTISPRGVERYEAAAYTVAGQVLDEAHRAWMPCEPVASVDEDCAAEVIGLVGRRAWRRPLTPDEVDAIVAVTTEAATALGDFHEGLAFGLAALLQSPDFLMRPELGEEDPSAPGLRRYTAHELAARLSFLLWDSIPDDVLLDAADAGDLHDPEKLAVQVDRMIADPRARRGLRAFVDDLLELGALATIQKDPGTFVNLADGLFTSAREETLRLFEDVVFDRDVDLGEVLTTRRTFLDRQLATLYGVPAPAPDGFAAAELPADGPRAGLLGHASFLALRAHPTSSSATLRGKTIRTTLLCGSVPAPPAGVNTSIPEPSPEAPTLRDRIKVHLETPACASCHEQMDLPGLGLEQFDGLGAFRTTEAGAVIDVSGELDDQPFTGLVGLAEAIRAHEDFVPCLVDQVTRAGLGRELGDGDEAARQWLVERFASQDHRLRALWRDLALAPIFRRVGEVSE